MIEEEIEDSCVSKNIIKTMINVSPSSGKRLDLFRLCLKTPQVQNETIQ